jgi:RecA/RadA recombinase
MDRAMTMIPVRPDEPLGGALARLEARWGSAAIRLGSGRRIDALAPTSGALALLPAPEVAPSPTPDAEVVSTGFPALDVILGMGGLPRRATATFRGDASSGKTTLALCCVTAAQAAGGIVAWLDLARAFDPLEAAARGVDLRWLVVLRPVDPEEGLRLAGALVSGRAVDLLVLDLPPRLRAVHEALLRRLAAHARRIGVQLLVLEPAALPAALHGALAEAAGLRLELVRTGWIRLGRDVVGQRTAVTVAKNRYGPPGRHTELEIRYLDDGERTAGVARLLDAASEAGGQDTGPPSGYASAAPRGGHAPAAPPGAGPRSVQMPPTPLVIIDHAPSPPRLAPSPTPPRAGRPGPALDAGDAARPRRAALGAGDRARSQSGRGAPRRPSRPAAGERS